MARKQKKQKKQQKQGSTGRDLSAILRHAVSLVKSGALQEASDYLSIQYSSHPESLELVKLWYLAVQQGDDAYDSAAIALRVLADGYHSELGLRWLQEQRVHLIRRNEGLMDLACRIPGALGLKVRIWLTLASGDAIEGQRLYRELSDNWPEEEGYGALDIADDLTAMECHLYAEPYYWKAIEADPENLVLIRKLVQSLLFMAEQTLHEKATEAFQLAQRLWQRYPESPEAWFALALVWRRAASRPDRAAPHLSRYLQVFPESPWRSAFAFDIAYIDHLAPEEVFHERCAWSQDFCRIASASSDIGLERPSDAAKKPLRVGYVSPDFGKHPVGFFCQTILKQHDRTELEVFLYSERNPIYEDDIVSRELREWAGESHWRWSRQMSAAKLLDCVRADRIDILVDLAGHSKSNRLDVFGNRAAPIQLTWLGFPGSTGMQAIDYRISDDIVEPEGEADSLSSEKIWRMPNGFHAISFPDSLPEPVPPPCLENGYITFGSFNNCNKVGIESCRLWARVLREIPQARLLLKHQTMEIFANRESMRSLFASEGVDPARISFKGITADREDHFAYYAMMDVALDPLTYNGTTTTCEALYMGVPVLTLLGRSHPGRVSASLLHRMGMDGWVAQDEDGYVKVAKAAAARPEALAKRRAGMRAAYKNSPLNDGAAMASDLEHAYRQMWQAKCAENSSI